LKKARALARVPGSEIFKKGKKIVRALFGNKVNLQAPFLAAQGYRSHLNGKTALVLGFEVF
jgi:hypothetical protein